MQKSLVWAVFLIALLPIAEMVSGDPPPLGPVVSPVAVEPRLHEGVNVRISWQVPSGTEQPSGYEIHRSAIASEAVWASPASLVATTQAAARSITVCATAAEISANFTYYYSVVGLDDEGRRLVSAAVPANPHGTHDVASTGTCAVCHEPHDSPEGALVLGAGGAGGCYRCHGDTDETDAHGAGALTDIQNVFFDDTSQTAPAGGSIHRADGWSENGTQCSACHEPHLRAVTDSPVRSFTNLLFAMLDGADGEPTYSTEAAPLGDRLCTSCHGPDSSVIAANAGDEAHAETAGDHSSSSSAHSSATVPATPGEPNQCAVCHRPHASPAAGLVDYRLSGVETTQNVESGLCFRCHTNNVFRAMEEDRGEGKPYTWNARDIWEEFSGTSAHPIFSSGERLVAAADTRLSVDTKDEFDASSPVNLVAYSDAPERVTLAYSSGLEMEYPDLHLMYVNDGGVARYRTWETGWNKRGFDPPEPPSTTGSGSTMVNAEDRLHLMRGENSGTPTPTHWIYEPPAGSGPGTWTTGADAPSGVGTGADSTVDPTNRLVYVSAGDGSPEIMKLAYPSDTWGTSIRFAVAGVETSLGVGSAIAYSPQADRLFVINKNGTNGDGKLYYLDSPATASGATNFTVTTIQATRPAMAVHNRMVRVTVLGTDYLYTVGTIPGSSTMVQNYGNLGGNVVRGTATGIPFSFDGHYFMEDGGDLAWDGDRRLFAVQGGGRVDFSYRTIPDNPLTESYHSWQEWGYYQDYSGHAAGTAIAGAWTDPPPYTGSGYPKLGSLTTTPVVRTDDMVRWDKADWSREAWGDTSTTMDVEGWDGSDWRDIPGYTGQTEMPLDLSAIDIDAWTALRLRVNFHSPTYSGTPTLYRVSLSVIRETTGTGGSLTCVNCHNTHLVETGGAQAWDMTRVSDPANTAAGFAGSTTEFCLTCHDETPPQKSKIAGSYVRYSVGFRDLSSYVAFKGWDKSRGGSGFSQSAHATAPGTKALCENCHDPHGSSNRSLLAWTRPAGMTTGTAGTRDNTSTAAFEENLCFQCHGNGTTGSNLPGAADIASAIAQTNGHKVENWSDRHSSTELPSDTWVSFLNKQHVECVDCHDPHLARSGVHSPGDSAPSPALVGATGVVPQYGNGNFTNPVSFEATQLSGVQGSEAYVCLKCHSSYQYVRPGSEIGDIALHFNPENQGGHNVTGNVWPKTTTAEGLLANWGFPTDAVAFKAGSGMTRDTVITCSDCHGSADLASARGPHGSSIENILVIDGQTPETHWYETTLDTWNDADFLCGRCHNPDTNNVHTFHWHRELFTCGSCHIAVPHGWKRPRLLIAENQGDQATWIRPNKWNNVNMDVRVRDHSSTTWAKNDCAAACDFTGHTTFISGGSAWP